MVYDDGILDNTKHLKNCSENNIVHTSVKIEVFLFVRKTNPKAQYNNSHNILDYQKDDCVLDYHKRAFSKLTIYPFRWTSRINLFC